MSARVILLADGPRCVWSEVGAQPKQLLEPEGEPILHRAVRLFVAGGAEVWISGPFEVAGAHRVTLPHDPRNGGADKYLRTAPCWSAADRTILAYGDVWYSEAAVGAILGHTARDWHLFARFGPSAWTGKPWAEPFAQSFWPEHQADHQLDLLEVGRLERAGQIPRSGTWEVYKLRHDVLLPFSYAQRALGDDATVIDDWTEDFDYPIDVVRWRDARAKAGIR